MLYDTMTVLLSWIKGLSCIRSFSPHAKCPCFARTINNLELQKGITRKGKAIGRVILREGVNTSNEVIKKNLQDSNTWDALVSFLFSPKKVKRRTFPEATRGTSHFKFVLGSAGVGSAGVDSVGVVERVNRLTIGQAPLQLRLLCFKQVFTFSEGLLNLTSSQALGLKLS